MTENGMMDFADGWSAEDTEALRATAPATPPARAPHLSTPVATR